MKNGPRLYVPLDVDFPDDPAIVNVSPAAELLYVRALCLVKRLLSDGAIATAHLRRLGDKLDAPHLAAAELVDAGLWIATDTGWTIRAWLDHNKSSAQVKADGEAEAQRKAQWREAKSKRDASTDPTATRRAQKSRRVASAERDMSRGENATSTEAETETETETKQAASASVSVTDHDRTIELLLLRRQRHAERSGKPIQNHDAWTRSVRAGLITEHGDRIAADLALGLAPDTIAASILPDRNNDPPMAAHHKLDTNAVMARALALVAPEDR